MTSIIDVAKLPVSPKSTVSRNFWERICEVPIVRKILKAMKELNYTPNYVARNLRAGATKPLLLALAI